MKLVREYENRNAAKRLALKLRKHGILNHVGISSREYVGGGEMSMSPSYTKTGVWTVIDKQYPDAVKLSRGKRHTVKHPLTEEQMRELESAAEEAFNKSLRRKVNFIAAIPLMVLISVIAYYIVMSN